MLELRDLGVTFNAGSPIEVHALRGVGLSVRAGEFVTVIGTNGAGKSTLISVVAGDVLPECGGVTIDGIDVTRWPTEARAHLVGRVFQDPRVGTCESLTIEENLALASVRSRRRGLRAALGDGRMRRRFVERLEGLGLGLERRLKARVGTLSGGQRQAIGLLMATLLPMKLLLLDEHTAALDPRAARLILELSDGIAEEQRLTVLMVTHSMRQSLDHGDRTIMMSEGRVVLDISGPARRGYQVDDLLRLFESARGAAVDDDALMLS
jgi:putative tryptophan/tyrosine transport system ATP-binding protein